jgi:hypothetical protein
LLFANSQIFWFGDLNYRINMSDGEVRKLVDLKKWDKLMSHDQVGIIKLKPNYSLQYDVLMFITMLQVLSVMKL